MAVETGIAVWANTGAGLTTPLHLLKAGVQWGKGAPSQSREALSGAVKVAGPKLPKISLGLFPVDANCLIDKILRATETAQPADVPLVVGNSSNSCSSAAWKINVAELVLEANGALEITYELVQAAAPTYGAGSTPGTKVKTTFEAWRGSVTTGGADKKARRIRVRFHNNYQPAHDLGAKASHKLNPTSIAPGPEVVEAEIEYMDDPSHDCDTDEMPTSTIVLAAVSNASPAKTITVTLTDMKVPEWYYKAGGAKTFGLYTVPYESDENNIAGRSIAIA